MDDASLQLNTPMDRYNIVYFIFILHGIGTLMPWNMFINANDVSKISHSFHIFMRIKKFLYILSIGNCF